MKSFFYFQSITAVRNQNVGKTLKHDFWIALVHVTCWEKNHVLEINIFYQNKKSTLKLDFNCC